MMPQYPPLLFPLEKAFLFCLVGAKHPHLSARLLVGKYSRVEQLNMDLGLNTDVTHGMKCMNAYMHVLCVLLSLEGTNISQLGRSKISFKSALGWDVLVPWTIPINVDAVFFQFPFQSPFPHVLCAAKRSELLLHWYRSIKLPESSIPIAFMGLASFFS